MTAAYVPGGLGWFVEIEPAVQRMLLELSSARRDFSVNDTLRAVVEAAHALELGSASDPKRAGVPSLSDYVLGAGRAETVGGIAGELRGLGNYQSFSGDYAQRVAERLDRANERARRALARVLLVHLARTGSGALDPESLESAGAAVEEVQRLYREGGAE